MSETDCLDQELGRRRLFWTTQPRVCGEYTLCGANCVIPGLEYEDRDDPVINPLQIGPTTGARARTIKTNDWVRSLVLNILNTRARTDKPCPAPTAIYGHWSESYRSDGLYIGASMWNAADKPYVRINEAVRSIQAAVQADISKLIALGVADQVDVAASYVGRMTVAIIIKIVKRSKLYVLNLSGTYSSGLWAWN